MKQSSLIACLLAAGLMSALLLLTGESPPHPSGSLALEVDQAVQAAAQKPADLSDVAADAGRQSAGAPSPTAPSALANAPAAPLSALISVTVLPASGAAPSLAGLVVRASSLQSNATVEAAPLGADGETELRVAHGGRYLVDVDPASVPDGFAASGKYRLGALDESGVAGAYTQVEDGGAVAVTLRVFGTSSLSGLVTGPDGLPLAGAVVRAQGLGPGMAGLAEDAVTNRTGDFVIKGLLPFVYGVNVVDPGANADGWDGSGPVPQPPRQLFDLQYGPYAGVHLALGSGGRTVAGRVVDELGEPFEDISVRAFYVEDEAHGVALPFQRAFDWSDHAFLARTDAKGRFRVVGLGNVPFRILVGIDEAKNSAGRRVKYFPPPVDVALGPGSPGLVDVGAIELVRSRRFTVKGRVELLSEEHPELRLKHRRLQLEVAPYDDESAGQLGSGGRPGRETRPFVDYNRKTGAFTLSCDTPLDECALTVALRGQPELTKAFRFRPEPNETLADQVLSFP